MTGDDITRFYWKMRKVNDEFVVNARWGADPSRWRRAVGSDRALEASIEDPGFWTGDEDQWH